MYILILIIFVVIHWFITIKLLWLHYYHFSVIVHCVQQNSLMLSCLLLFSRFSPFFSSFLVSSRFLSSFAVSSRLLSSFLLSSRFFSFPLVSSHLFSSRLFSSLSFSSILFSSLSFSSLFFYLIYFCIDLLLLNLCNSIITIVL